MGITEEVQALLGENRKETAARLDVSTGRLSQWSTGAQLITEPHLASLVDHRVKQPDLKDKELLRLLLLLWQERIREDDKDSKRRWAPASRDLALRAIERALKLTADRSPAVKSSDRTLCDFPDSFYPLAIISGDKREDSESRITAGDFGAVSASHAEFRWLCQLGLREDVELYGDKVFVLESAEQLKARFGDKHLLIVGSPGSNHLARRCLLASPRAGWRPAAPLFRFNLPQYTLQKIEAFLETLHDLRAKQLVGKSGEESTERDMKHWLHYLFTGGIIDPTHTHHWVRGHELPPNRDYGLITLARNPFSDPSGESRLCIMVAGFHLLGTAHALRRLATPERFEHHPLGGVIKVSIDTGRPFAKRFDESTADWDDEIGYKIDDFRERLNIMQTESPPTLNMSHEGIGECLTFLAEL